MTYVKAAAAFFAIWMALCMLCQIIRYRGVSKWWAARPRKEKR